MRTHQVKNGQWYFHPLIWHRQTQKRFRPAAHRHFVTCLRLHQLELQHSYLAITHRHGRQFDQQVKTSVQHQYASRGLVMAAVGLA
jgi:hypothetical protein